MKRQIIGKKKQQPHKNLHSSQNYVIEDAICHLLYNGAYILKQAGNSISFTLLFPIPQVSLKVSSKVTLFMNFSNWNALLRIVILLLCDLGWKAACTKLERTLWIKAERLGTEIYNEHQSTWGPVLLPQKWAARVWFWFCWSSYKSRATSMKLTWVKSEQAVFQPLNSQHITHCILHKTLSQLDFACMAILGQNGEDIFKVCLKRKAVMIQQSSGLAEPIEPPPAAQVN